MGLTCLKCNLSLKISSSIIVLIEIIAAAAVGILCALNWKIISETQRVIYFYTPHSGEFPDVTNANIAACVTYWILSLVGLMTILHLVLAVILFVSVKRKSQSMAKLWMAMKGLGIIFALFLSIASMTTIGWYTKIVAITDLTFHLVTAFYIKILYESLGDFDTLMISKNMDEF